MAEGGISPEGEGSGNITEKAPSNPTEASDSFLGRLYVTGGEMVANLARQAGSAGIGFAIAHGQNEIAALGSFVIGANLFKDYAPKIEEGIKRPQTLPSTPSEGRSIFNPKDWKEVIIPEGQKLIRETSLLLSGLAGNSIASGDLRGAVAAGVILGVGFAPEVIGKVKGMIRK